MSDKPRRSANNFGKHDRDGFVHREPAPNDRRMMSVSITPKGEMFLRDFLPGHFKVTAAIMSSLTEAERKTLVRLLVKIQEQVATLNPQRSAAIAAS